MISTITVNYKTADYLEKMLTSLFAFHSPEEVEVIVVENGSGEDLSFLVDRYPSIQLIESEVNLGFAGGCNVGIAHAHGDFLCLLNPDIVFTSPALREMEQAMRADPSIGIGGISLKNLDNTQQACVWKYPTPTDQWLMLMKVHHIVPSITPIAQWRMDTFDYAQDADVDQVMGAFFCIRREVIERIGTLDERFFMWYEEVDFCRRTTQAGWRVRYFSSISAQHKKGSSFDRVPTIKKQAMLRRSVRRYLRKHFGLGIWSVFVVCEPLFYGMSVLASLIKPI